MAPQPDCLARLQLRQPPFEASGGETFVHTDPVLDAWLAAASRGLESPWGIVLLSGEPGSGRSLRLTRLLSILPDRADLIAFRARAGIRFDAIESTIRSQLHVANAEDARHPLHQLLALRAPAGRGAILAIDDAHLLGRETHDGLLRLRQAVRAAGGSGLRLLLVGDPAFATAGPAATPADVTRLEVAPFTLEQTRGYLYHRLRAAGRPDPESLLMPEEIASLHAESGGYPAALNACATQWLEAYCESLRDLTAARPSSRPDAESARPAAPPAPELEPLIRERPEPRAAQRVVRRGHSSSVAAREDPMAEAGPPPVLEGLFARGESPRPRPSAPRRPARRQTRSSDPAGLLSSWYRQHGLLPVAAGGILLILLPVLWYWSGPETPAPENYWEHPRPLPTDAVEDDGRSGAPATPTHPPAPRPARVMDAIGRVGAMADSAETPEDNGLPAAAEPPTIPPITDLAAEKAWLARQNPRRFTIQLIALSSLEAAERYVRQAGLSEVRYLPTRRGQQDFVVVLSGNYPTQAAAEQAARELPESIRAQGAWIRSFGSVGEVLR